jgi:ankyrin repeat protein
MKAIKGGYKEIAQLLLDLGININLHNIHGDTALHWAVNNLTNNSSLFAMNIFISQLILCIYKFNHNST